MTGVARGPGPAGSAGPFPDPADWESAVFCLIGPDSVRRQLVRPILDRFAADGLHPSNWRSVEVTSAQVDAMTEANVKAAGQAYRYRCLDVLFSLGPSLALRLWDRRGRSADRLYRDCAVLKGASDPARARPGTIRRDLGSINAVLSLLHVSDSPPDSARESLVILGSAGDVQPPGWRDPGGLGQWLDLTARSRPAERRSFEDVLLAVRSRILIALDDCAQLDGIPTDPPAGWLLSTDVAALPQESLRHVDSRLVELLTASWQPDRPQPDIDRADRLLRGIGTGLDPWERAVLATSTYFASARSTSSA